MKDKKFIDIYIFLVKVSQLNTKNRSKIDILVRKFRTFTNEFNELLLYINNQFLGILLYVKILS